MAKFTGIHAMRAAAHAIAKQLDQLQVLGYSTQYLEQMADDLIATSNRMMESNRACRLPPAKGPGEGRPTRFSE